MRSQAFAKFRVLHGGLKSWTTALELLRAGYQIREGLKGVLVRARDGNPRVFVLTQPASHYCQVMTRNEREPVMVGETI